MKSGQSGVVYRAFDTEWPNTISVTVTLEDVSMLEGATVEQVERFVAKEFLDFGRGLVEGKLRERLRAWMRTRGLG